MIDDNCNGSCYSEFEEGRPCRRHGRQPPSSDSLSGALEKLRAIGARVARLRNEMAPDSPLQPVAFKVAALIGDIEATLAATNPITSEITGANRGGVTP